MAYPAWKRNASIELMIHDMKIATEWCLTGRRCDGNPTSGSRTGHRDASDRAAGAQGGGEIMMMIDTMIDAATGVMMMTAATSAVAMTDMTIGLTTGEDAETRAVCRVTLQSYVSQHVLHMYTGMECIGRRTWAGMLSFSVI